MPTQTWYCPVNWRDLTIFPGLPGDYARTMYFMEDGVPMNGMNCAPDMAEFIWPGGDGTIWAIDPIWHPPNFADPWPPVTDPVQPIWPEVWPPEEAAQEPVEPAPEP